MKIDPKLLEILVCPISRKPLTLIEDELICNESKLAYTIKDGIPIMIPEKARKIQDKDS